MMADHNYMSVAATCYEPESVMGTSLAAMTDKDFNCRESILPDNGGGMPSFFIFYSDDYLDEARALAAYRGVGFYQNRFFHSFTLP